MMQCKALSRIQDPRGWKNLAAGVVLRSLGVEEKTNRNSLPSFTEEREGIKTLTMNLH